MYRVVLSLVETQNFCSLCGTHLTENGQRIEEDSNCSVCHTVKKVKEGVKLLLRTGSDGYH